MGGDGTVHEVANGLLTSTHTPLPDLGILPRGTGDDFVRALGIPVADIDALTVLRDGRAARARRRAGALPGPGRRGGQSRTS